MELPCACCFPSIFFVFVGVLFIIFKLIDYFILSIFEKYKVAKKTYLIFSRFTSVLIGLIAVGVGIVSQNGDTRNWLFYKFAVMTSNKTLEFDTLRCEHVKNLSGRVLELGPGPGNNFKCWDKDSKITEWVGVEPNKYFHEFLKLEHENRNLTFPMSTICSKGEDLDIPPQSFDAVLATHVLCSVGDILLVLKQIHRALKSGGVYYYLEHVAAQEGTWKYYGQRAFEPIVNILGNGCAFKSIWLDLTPETGLVEFKDIHLRHVAAPIPFFAFEPHIIGYATKI